MKIFKGALLLALVLSNTSPALAATKVIKVVPAKAISSLTFSGAPGDQFFGASTSSNSIIYIGTVESATATPALGMSDGYIAAILATGVKQWELRLGGVTDDIATAVAKDKSGNYWVLGASCDPAVSVAINPVAPGINPDSATAEPTTSPTTFNRIFIWKVSSTGSLLASYNLTSPQSIFPKTLTSSATGFTITGDLADSTSFTLPIDSVGVFGSISPLTLKKIVPPAIDVIAAGSYTFKSFISKTTILGIPSWKPKTPTPVVLEYTKAKTLKAAYSIKGTVIFRAWQSGLGLVLITQDVNSTLVYVLPLVA